MLSCRVVSSMCELAFNIMSNLVASRPITDDAGLFTDMEFDKFIVIMIM